MIDPYDHIRQNLDIEEVARRYGLEVNRHHKALCLFHNDHHESMSFKNNRFKCFACGAGGSAIDLVAKLFDLEPLEAVKKLNADFGLGLDFKGEYDPIPPKYRKWKGNGNYQGPLMIGSIRRTALTPGLPVITGKICRNTGRLMKGMSFTLYMWRQYTG